MDLEVVMSWNLFLRIFDDKDATKFYSRAYQKNRNM